MASDPAKRGAAAAAVELIESGMMVGLGSGSTAEIFVRLLAERIRAGLAIRAVSTSVGTQRLAESLGIAVEEFGADTLPDVDVDGADQVDDAGNMIKGYGGALLREKIVASASRRVVIMVDPSKLAPRLDKPVPVEVVQFGWTVVARRIEALGATVTRRLSGNAPSVSDNGNFTLDCAFGALEDPPRLDASVREIAGVVATGLFVGLLDVLLIGQPEGCERREFRRRS